MGYVFSDFELEPDSYRLTRAGEGVRVEPRVLELLALLVAERHRVVGKEELIDRLWAGQFVSDGVLTRAIYAARRAIGDDSRGQRFIKTVHGRGYQFVAPVEAIGEEDGREAPAAPEPAPRVAQSEPAMSRERTDPGSRWRRWRLWVELATLFVVTATAIFLVSRSTANGDGGRQSARRGAAPETLRLAVLPVVAADVADTELGLVALSITELLSARLQSVPTLVVRSPQLAAALGETSPSLAELAAEAEVTHLLTGSVRRRSRAARAHLTVELHTVQQDGALDTLPLGSFELPLLEPGAEIAAFVRVRESVVASIQSRLTPAVTTAGSASAPGDPEAYRLFLLARKRLETVSCGEGTGIDELLARSVELDPGFALAWVARGFALYSETWSCGREAAYADRALAAAEQALAIEPHMPIATYLKALLLTEAGRVEEAYALLRAAQGRHPRSPAIRLAQSYALRYAGFLERSVLALERALALDPLVLWEYGEAPVAYLYLGRYEEFLRTLPGGSTPSDLYYRGWAEHLRGNRDASALAVDSAFEQNPADMFGRFAAALSAWLAEDTEAATEIVRGIVRQRQALGTPDAETTYREGVFFAALGEPRAAIARLAQAVDQGFFCPSCLQADPFLASLRGDPDFDEILARARRRHREFGTQFQFRERGTVPARP